MVRSVFSILIVADHLTFWISSPLVQPFRKWGAPIVSIFLFISGFGLMKQYASLGNEYLKSFWRKRMLKVIVPPVLALAAYWLICFDPERNYLEAFKNLFVYGVPLSPYAWYAWAIVILYSSFWLSFRFLPQRFKAMGVLVLSLTYVAATIIAGYDRCWWVCTLAFPTGLYYAKYEFEIHKVAFKNRLSYCAAFALMLLGVALFYVTKSEYAYLMCYVFISAAVAMVVSSLKLEKLNNKVVVFLASISYEIYLCQGIAMEFLRPKIDSDILFAATVYAMTILLAYAVHKIASLIKY